jgi:hypothetical protein
MIQQDGLCEIHACPSICDPAAAPKTVYRIFKKFSTRFLCKRLLTWASAQAQWEPHITEEHRLIYAAIFHTLGEIRCKNVHPVLLNICEIQTHLGRANTLLSAIATVVARRKKRPAHNAADSSWSAFGLSKTGWGNVELRVPVCRQIRRRLAGKSACCITEHTVSSAVLFSIWRISDTLWVFGPAQPHH